MRWFLLALTSGGIFMCSPMGGESHKETATGDFDNAVSDSVEEECPCPSIDSNSFDLVIDLGCYCDWFSCPIEQELIETMEREYSRLSTGTCDEVTAYGPKQPLLGGSSFAFRGGQIIGARTWEDIPVYCGHYEVKAGDISCRAPLVEDEFPDPCDFEEEPESYAGYGGCRFVR